MKFTLFLSVLTFTLSACSTISDLPPGYRVDLQDDEGVAIVSLTLSGRDFDSVSRFAYRVRAVGDETMEEAKRRPYFNSAKQHAKWLQDSNAHGPTTTHISWVVKDQYLAEPLDVIESGRPIGRVAALRLPPGSYELYSWTLMVPNEYGGTEFSPKRAFSYRFRVEAGRAAYLGNVDLAVTEHDTYKVSAKEMGNRDLALIAKRAWFSTIGNVTTRLGELRSQ